MRQARSDLPGPRPPARRDTHRARRTVTVTIETNVARARARSTGGNIMNRIALSVVALSLCAGPGLARADTTATIHSLRTETAFGTLSTSDMFAVFDLEEIHGLDRYGDGTIDDWDGGSGYLDVCASAGCDFISSPVGMSIHLDPVLAAATITLEGDGQCGPLSVNATFVADTYGHHDTDLEDAGNPAHVRVEVERDWSRWARLIAGTISSACIGDHVLVDGSAALRIEDELRTLATI